MNRIRAVLGLSALLACTACDSVSVPAWMGGADEKKLPGNRIAIMEAGAGLAADPLMESVPVELPDILSNSQWTQAGGRPAGAMGHLAHTGGFEEVTAASVGEGGSWEENTLVTSPIVASGLVIAMDAEGIVSAHTAADISQVRWVSKAAKREDRDEVLGGGLAAENGTVFVSTGTGNVVALDMISGAERWRKDIGLPVRGAPRVSGGQIYVVTVDNQLMALSATEGALLWNHRGIAESAGFLSMVVPAASTQVVVVAYTSGELHALKADSGEELWSDTLNLSTRTSATGAFTGIDASPVIAGNMVYAVSSAGLMMANELDTGKRLWEVEIASRHTPWPAGDFIYVLSNTNQLVCLYAPNGRVKWVAQLPSFADEEKKAPFNWNGPLLVGEELVVIGAHGQLVTFSPLDGKQTATHDIHEGVIIPPIVADGTLYLLSAGAKLLAIR